MRGRTEDIADDATATPSGKSEARGQLEQELDELERSLHPTESRVETESASEGSGHEITKSSYLAQLRQALVTHFDVDELRNLCFELGQRLEDVLGTQRLSYDSLSGAAKLTKATELVAYCDRRNRISELAKEINRYCPGSVLYPPPEAVERASSQTQSLPTVLVTRFDESELRDLYFDLGADYDTFPGTNIADKARELISYLHRRGRIRALTETGKRLRPDISWDDTLEASKPLLSQLSSYFPEHSSEERELEADSVTASLGSQHSSPQHSQPEQGSDSAILESDKRSQREKTDRGITFVDLLPLGLKLGSLVTGSLERLFRAKPKDAQEIAASQIQLLNGYYLLALRQARQSFTWALIAAGVALIFFVASVTFLLTERSQDVAIAGIISGALVQVISGINFYLYGKASSQLADFRASLDLTQRFLLANGMCEGIEGDLRKQARSHLVLAVAGTDAALTLPQTITPPQTPAPPQAVPPQIGVVQLPDADVHITYVLYNPPGDDMQGEHIRLKNSGGTAADMTNWTMRDKAGHEFTFPAFTLKPGSHVRVWTKAGTNTSTDLYWGRKQALWNNTGDCAYLRDDAGTAIDEYCYSTPATHD